MKKYNILKFRFNVPVLLIPSKGLTRNIEPYLLDQ